MSSLVVLPGPRTRSSVGLAKPSLFFGRELPASAAGFYAGRR